MDVVVAGVLVLVLFALPVGFTVYSAVVPDSAYATIDSNKIAWVLICLLVPFGWLAFVLSPLPKLLAARRNPRHSERDNLGAERAADTAAGSARPRHEWRAAPGDGPYTRSEALALYRKGFRSDGVMLALSPKLDSQNLGAPR